MKTIIKKLSKSSPYAVATPDLDREVFDYLYIDTDIEKEYLKTLQNSTQKEIIFLCGSSGDGKAEILPDFIHKQIKIPKTKGFSFLFRHYNK